MENISTIIICVLLALICVYAVISYKNKLRNGCCGGGGAEEKIKPQDTNTSHYSHKSIVYIDGMTCSNCATRVENTFNNMDGCYAKVNLRKKYAEVFSKQALSDIDIRRAVVKSGYSPVKTVFEK